MLSRSRLWFPVLALAACAAFLIAQTATPLEASGQVPYLSTNSTDASFAATTAGRTTTAPSNLFSIASAYGKRYRCLELTPFGAGTAATTFDYKVWVVKRGVNQFNGTAVDYEKQLYCHGTCTLGTTVGAVSSGGIKTTDKICDTITVTVDSYCTAAVAAYGGIVPSVFSPGSNGCARLFLPDLTNASDIFIEFDMTGATSGNFLIERGT